MPQNPAFKIIKFYSYLLTTMTNYFHLFKNRLSYEQLSQEQNNANRKSQQHHNRQYKNKLDYLLNESFKCHNSCVFALRIIPFNYYFWILFLFNQNFAFDCLRITFIALSKHFSH